MLKISVPKPCHENWNDMSPREQGRHCNTCAKTVVDFTNMNDEEVKNFFLNRTNEKVCGRFKTEQLHRITINLPENIFKIPMPLWKRFLAACLIAFSTTLFSCDTHVGNKNTSVAEAEIKKPQDSIVPRVTVGKLKLVDTPAPKCNIIKTDTPVLMGDVSMPPSDTIKPPIETVEIGKVKIDTVEIGEVEIVVNPAKKKDHAKNKR